nr:MAG TPA: hypothetical protein [Caudoviricetes sp.]
MEAGPFSPAFFFLIIDILTSRFRGTNMLKHWTTHKGITS